MSKQLRKPENNAPIPKRAEGLPEFARSLSISYDSAYRAAKDGRLKKIQFGKRILIPSDEIERVMREGL
jgi:excisionase family DNA binding protein